MPVYPTTPVPATPFVTQPTTNQVVDVPQGWKEIRTLNVSALNVELTKIVPRTPLVYQTDVLTHACMITLAPHQLAVQLRTIMPSVCVLQVGLAIHLYPAGPRNSQIFWSQSLNAVLMVTVLMILPA
jgi:hypothetical protein